MSMDFDIVTFKKPEQSDIEEFASEYPLALIDGPFEVDAIDLPEVVTATVLAPRWLMQLSLPEVARKKDVSAAKTFASYIAESYQGGAYDCQKDMMLWPKGKRKRYSAPKEQERIRLIELEWFLPVEISSPKTAKLFLDLLCKICPEAFPTRYGTFKPLQEKMDINNIKPFLETWKFEGEDVVGTFFWNANNPCFGGGVFFAERHDIDIPLGASLCSTVYMSFDGRALHGDARWCETVVTLFLTIAKSLEAFYATGYVLRNVIAKRNTWFDNKSEESPLPKSRFWLGIPDEPTWLSWFGAAYKPLVEEALKKICTQNTDEGIFVRLGYEPMDKDELQGLAPMLPPELLVRYEMEAPDSERREAISSFLKSMSLEVKHKWETRRIPKPAEYIPSF